MIPLPLIGSNYKHRSLPVSAQVTKNMYIDATPETKDKACLVPTPGTKAPWASTGAVCRGFHVMDGALYQVAGTSLYHIDSNGVATVLGSIPGNTRVSMSSSDSILVVVDNTGAYKYESGALEKVAGLTNPKAVAFLNQQACYIDGNSLVTSNLIAPGTIHPNNYVVLDTGLMNCIAFKDRLYLFFNNKFQAWYNSAVGRPPFDYVSGTEQTVGLGAQHSLAHNDDLIYFLGDNKKIYQFNGASVRPIDSLSVANELSKVADLSLAVGRCFSWFGRNYYSLTVGGKTHVYDESNNYWFEMGTGKKQHLMSSYAFAYGKHLVSDYRNANIYEWDFDTYSDNGEVIIRERTTAPIDSSMFGNAGVHVFMSELELVVETGVGIENGQGSKPLVMMSYSDDGGETWSTERTGSLGESGQFTIRVRWHNLGRFYKRIFKFKVSDPVNFTLRQLFGRGEMGVA